MARGAFHHALIIPATFLTTRPKGPGHGTKKVRREALYDSEDLARHLANYVMNQIPTLSIAHISSNDIIAPDIWSDPIRVYACLFVKGSRILFLVTHQDAEGFANFSIQRLQPLLEQAQALDYDWKSRFLVVAMGEFHLPESTPCEVIRFREIGWFRDSMALFVLGKKIQEFCTPIQSHPSESIAKTEKLRFLTNVEETETFKASMYVKNMLDEDSTESQENDLDNVSIYAHNCASESDDNSNYSMGQNFSFRIDIESDRLLDIHELLISNTSSAGLDGIMQPYSSNARYFCSRSELGYTGSSSDLDVGSSVLDETRTTSESVGEMHWSSPDSVSVVQETDVKALLSSNDDERTIIANDAEGPSVISPPNVAEKLLAGLDHMETLETQLSAKGKLSGNDQCINQPNDTSPTHKTLSFQPQKSEVSTKIIGEISTEIQPDSIPERSVGDAGTAHQNQTSSGIQRSRKTPYSTELETKSPILKRLPEITTKESPTHQENHFVVEPPHLKGQDELSENAPAELVHSSSRLSHLPPSISTVTEEFSRSDELKSTPGFFNTTDNRSGCNTMTSGGGRVSQPSLQVADKKSFLPEKEEITIGDEPEFMLCSPKSISSDMSKKGVEIRRRSLSLTDSGAEGKYDDNGSPLISETGTPPGKSQPALRTRAGSPKRRDPQGSSSVQTDAMTQSKESKVDAFTAVANLNDEHVSDAYAEQFKHEFAAPLNGDLGRKSGSVNLNTSLENINANLEVGTAEKISTTESLLSAPNEQECKDKASSKWLTSPTVDNPASTPTNLPTNSAKIESLEVGEKSRPSKQEGIAQAKTEMLHNVNKHTLSPPKRVLGSENFGYADPVKNENTPGDSPKKDTGPENAESSKPHGIQPMIEKLLEKTSNEAMDHDDTEAVPLKPKLFLDELLTDSASSVNVDYSSSETIHGESLAGESPENMKNIDFESANTGDEKLEWKIIKTDAKKAVDSTSELAVANGEQQNFNKLEKMGSLREKMSDESRRLEGRTSMKAVKLVSKPLCGDYEAAVGDTAKNDVSKKKEGDGNFPNTSSFESSTGNVLGSEEISDVQKSEPSGEEGKSCHGKLVDPHFIKNSDAITLTLSILPSVDFSEHQTSRHSISDQKFPTTSIRKLAEIQGSTTNPESGVDNRSKADIENITKAREDLPDEYRKSAAVNEAKQMSFKRNDSGSDPDTTDYDNIKNENESPSGGKCESSSESERKDVDKERSQNNYFSKSPCHEYSFQNMVNLGGEVSLVKIDEIAPEKPAGQSVIETMETALLTPSFPSAEKISMPTKEMAKREASKISNSDQESLATSFSQPSNFPESKVDATYKAKENERFPERKKSTVRGDTKSDDLRSDNSSSAPVITDQGQSKSKITNANETKERKTDIEGKIERTQLRKNSENPVGSISSSKLETFEGSKGSALVHATSSSESNPLSSDRLSRKVSLQSDSKKMKKMVSQASYYLPPFSELPSRNLVGSITKEKIGPEALTPEDPTAPIPAYLPSSAPQPIVVERKSVFEQTTEITELKTWRSNTPAIPLRFESPTFAYKYEPRISRQPATLMVKVNTKGGPSEIAKFENDGENGLLKSKPPFLSDIPKDSIKQGNVEENDNRKQTLGQETEIVKLSDKIKKSGEHAQSGRFPFLPSKCPSPYSDSDCDPEITSWTMTRPWNLWSSDQIPATHVPPLISPRTKSTVTTASIHAGKAEQNRNKPGDVLAPMHHPATVEEAMKSDTVVRRQKSCEFKARKENCFSIVSISDGEDQESTGVVDAETGSTSPKSRIHHPSGTMPIRVLHETGEYQRNLSTQVPKQGKNQEDVKLESYYRQLREAARQIDRNQLTYWCDRSAGSPTPLEFSIGSEITPDSSVISEISCVSGDEVSSTTGTKEKTVEALLSVYKALGKASRILANSNKIILKQVDQLKSEK